LWQAFKNLLLKMPPHPTPIFVAHNASIVPETVPSDSDTELEGDVAEIQQQMDAEKKRLEDDAKAQIVELREKKWKEKAHRKRQEKLDRERRDEETQKEAEWKKKEDVKCLRKMIQDRQDCKQAHWVDFDWVSSALFSMIQN